jgi:hypothetical protein
MKDGNTIRVSGNYAGSLLSQVGKKSIDNHIIGVLDFLRRALWFWLLFLLIYMI